MEITRYLGSAKPPIGETGGFTCQRGIAKDQDCFKFVWMWINSTRLSLGIRQTLPLR